MVFYPWMWLKPKKSVGAQERLYRHELQHVYQMASLGKLKFYWVYLRLLVKYGMKRHPMEMDAEAHENLPLTDEEYEWWKSKEIRLG